jgi:hypothetical protein
MTLHTDPQENSSRKRRGDVPEATGEEAGESSCDYVFHYVTLKSWEK